MMEPKADGPMNTTLDSEWIKIAYDALPMLQKFAQYIDGWADPNYVGYVEHHINVIANKWLHDQQNLLALQYQPESYGDERLGLMNERYEQAFRANKVPFGPLDSPGWLKEIVEETLKLRIETDDDVIDRLRRGHIRLREEIDTLKGILKDFDANKAAMEGLQTRCLELVQENTHLHQTITRTLHAKDAATNDLRYISNWCRDRAETLNKEYDYPHNMIFKVNALMEVVEELKNRARLRRKQDAERDK